MYMLACYMHVNICTGMTPEMLDGKHGVMAMSSKPVKMTPGENGACVLDFDIIVCSIL